ncbi:MAG: hypothetical protein IJW41_02195 [Oscillospiraceae bacterium]|nr:hypothetical protein [Oscillospiraceae bacterium]
MANTEELTPEQKSRYLSVYCGICRGIRTGTSQTARLGLSYDLTFLALLLMSLYEPEETDGKPACGLHPIKPRRYVDNTYIRYGADMNVALAYYKAVDDYEDDKSLIAKKLSKVFGKNLKTLEEKYPRQCRAMEECIRQLRQLENEGCQNPDEPAGCFGRLMGELLVYEEDLWSDTLRQMGMALGRFVYLADAATDYRKDLKKGSYNPFIAMDTGFDPARFEQYLVLAMGRCTDYFERLPLVQDKEILDNILYSGVWITYRRRSKKNDR